MKDKLVKYHRKASYYRTRKVALFTLAIMIVSASVAVPVSLSAIEANNDTISEVVEQ
jgi:hypothetical protein